MRTVSTLAALLFASAAPCAVLAQTPPPSSTAAEAQAGIAEPSEAELDAEDEANLVEEVVVTAGRPRGEAEVGIIEPEVQLNPADIRATGAGSLAELLEAIAPQVQSGRGRGGERPVILLNGRRISGFREIQGLPPEAILRVDILPEEAALRYGFRADQRVVNFVLRPRFRAITAELEGGGPTAGGRAEAEADVNVLRLNPNGRWTVDLEHERGSSLLESERDLTAATAGPDTRPFRTLIPETQETTVNGTLNRVIGDISATLNASVTDTDSRSLFGLATDGSGAALRREQDARTARVATALNGDVGDWRWSFTGGYDHARSETVTDPRAGAAAVERDRGESLNQAANAELVLNGSPLTLPAGEVSATIRALAEARRFESETRRAGLTTTTDLGRDRGALQASLDLPIASERNGVLQPLGDLSANVNLEVEQLSDFGTLRTLGGGLIWSPRDRLQFIASFTDEDGAPSVNQLGDPVLLTPGAQVLDFRTGQTVEVNRLDGGNADLLADNRRTTKLGATWRPRSESGRSDLSLTAEWTRTVIDDPISSLPAATPEIETAFPERFMRDAAGRLIQVDVRPLNFQSSETEQVRYGFNWSRRIGPEPQRGAGGRFGSPGARGGPAPGGGLPGQGQGRGQGGGGFGRGGGFGGPPGAGRATLALYHTIRLKDEILIRDGVPALDLLNGSAADGGGGRSEHQLQLQAGLFRNGLGARVDANWRSGTFVNGDAAFGSDRLDFSDLTTVNLRLFADLGQRREWVQRRPWLRGARVGLEVDNLFDDRVEVRDAGGLIPRSYEADRLDPEGRVVRLSVRKVFFTPPNRAGRPTPAPRPAPPGG